jgi:hypothetical protein
MENLCLHFASWCTARLTSTAVKAEKYYHYIAKLLLIVTFYGGSSYETVLSRS